MLFRKKALRSGRLPSLGCLLQEIDLPANELKGAQCQNAKMPIQNNLTKKLNSIASESLSYEENLLIFN